MKTPIVFQSHTLYYRIKRGISKFINKGYYTDIYKLRHLLKWGRNYDKDMNKLPETEYIFIADMDTNHIHAIIDGKWVTKYNFYYYIFKDELKLRKKYNLI